MEQTTLYYRQGSSDKVYQASIQPRDQGFVVISIFGRRGSTQQTAVKTPSPVSYDRAKAIYEKLIREKTAKGYTWGEDGTPYQHTDKVTTGVHCQLLNSICEEEAARLLADPAYCMQEKFDGRRLLIKKQDGAVTGVNRLGLAVSIPEPMSKCCIQCADDFIIDGEAIGDTLHAFDVLRIGDDEIGGLGYGERYRHLKDLLRTFPHPPIFLVETHFSRAEKAAGFEMLKRQGREGVVFKQVDAPYSAGRPASGGSQLKFKFVETASFIVGKVNGKRSVSLLLLDGESMTPAGNVTIPANQEIPEKGRIVECRYLYAFKESGAIFQPVFLGIRDDIPVDECSTGQLKFKGEV